jgi:hypothetical protein
MDGAWVCLEGRCRLEYLSELVNKIFSEIREGTNNYLFLHNLLTIVNAIFAISTFYVAPSSVHLAVLSLLKSVQLFGTGGESGI